MNIAILLTGHYRSAIQTYESFHQAFAHLQPKIFCHSYNKISHKNHVWWNKTGDGEKANKIITKDNFIFYKPTKLLIEQEQVFVCKDKPLYNEVGGYNSVHGMWYSIEQAYNLMLEYEKENNMQFDIVIKTRYDLFYNTKINMNEIKDVFKNPNTIYIIPSPHSLDYSLRHDSFIIISRNIFVKIIENFPKIMDKYFDVSIRKHKVIEGEFPFTMFLSENKNFDCQMKYSDLKLHIIRLSGERIPLFR